MRWAGRICGGAALAPQPTSPTLHQPNVRAGHACPGRGLPQSLITSPSPSSAAETEKNLRNLVEDEARACALLIK